MAETATVRGSRLRGWLAATAAVGAVVAGVGWVGGERDFAAYGVPGLRAAVLLGCFGLGLAVFAAARRPGLRRRWVEPATPRELGLIRCWACGVAAAVAALSPVVSVVHAPTARLVPMGLMDAVYAAPAGLGEAALWVATTPAATVAAQALTVALLLLAAAGWRTRWTLPAAAVAYLLLGGVPRSHLKFYHAGLAPFLALAVLSFLPCAAAFSLDARRRRRAGLDAPPPRAADARFGRARFLVHLAVALPYFAAGLSKFAGGGLFWAGPHNQRAMLIDQSLNPMGDAFFLPLLVATPGWVFGVMGVSALLAELGMVLTPVSRRARWVVPPVIAAMHVGTWLFMGIFFWESALLMLVYLPWRRRRPAEAGAKAPARSRPATPFALGCAVLVALAATPWMLRTEWYPLTAMQMFAGHHDADEVEHTRLYAVRASGATADAPFLDKGLLRLGRNLSLRAFDDAGAHRRVARLLADATAAANAREPQDPIVGLELRRFAYPLDGSRPDARAHPLGTLRFPPPPAMDTIPDFDALAWKSRPVVVAGAPDAVARQLDALREERAGLDERDVALVAVTGDGPAARAARERFGIDPGVALTVLLVGLDTGVKARFEDPAEPVRASRLFGLIDAMPMRRAEARGRASD